MGVVGDDSADEVATARAEESSMMVSPEDEEDLSPASTSVAEPHATSRSS